MRQSRHDEGAAATELGYVFTFLLGVVLLSMFGVWAYGIETATRERWPMKRTFHFLECNNHSRAC